MATRKAAEVPQDPEPMLPEGEDVEAVVSSAPPASVGAHVAMKEVARQKLAAEPRVRVKVHNDGPVPVKINGYGFLIREGVWVEVPESVAKILEDAGYC